jgi:uncharacterized protein with NRDE domain
MCLIAFAYQSHPNYPLVLIANRDEFYERPTQEAHFWSDDPNILAGRDLRAGGTWLGVHRNGRFAALTNFRDPEHAVEAARSRGKLPVAFLQSDQSPTSFIESLHEQGEQYNGFNLLLYDHHEMIHYSNRNGKIQAITPGIHGLSNALLDTSWPKVEFIKKEFSMALGDKLDKERALRVLQSEALAREEELPSTGVPLDWEKQLSAVCIRTPNYGTCCSTLLSVSYDGKVDFDEYTYPVGARKETQVSFTFTIQ